MSRYCKYAYCIHDDTNHCKEVGDCILAMAHDPDPNVAARSARTSGSPTASRSERERDDCSQLAPVLRPDCVADHEHDWDVVVATDRAVHITCVKCDDYRVYRRAK